MTKNRSVLFEQKLAEEENLAKNNEVTTEPKEVDTRMVGDVKTPDEKMTAPTEDVLVKTDDKIGDAKLGKNVSSNEVQPKNEAEDNTVGEKVEGKDSTSIKTAQDQPEGLEVPLKKEAEDITGEQKLEGKDSGLSKAGRKETQNKRDSRVRMKHAENTNTQQVGTDEDLHSLRTSVSSKVSGFSVDTRSLRSDDFSLQEKQSLDLKVDMEDVTQGDSDSDSFLSRTDSSLYRNTISMKSDFLLNMTLSLPNISDIEGSSSDEENEEAIEIIDDSQTNASADDGKFVNPLTGEDISSTESTETKNRQSSNVMEEEQELDVDGSEIDIEILSIGSDKEKKGLTMQEDYEEALVQLRQSMLKASIPQDDDIDLNMEARNQLLIFESTINFLTSLIDRTVLKAETIDTNAILEASLDKQLVLDEIYAKVLEYENERRNQQYLSTKIIDHYRRIRNFRPILPDPATTSQKLLANFRKSLEEFDYLLGQKNNFMRMHNEAMSANDELLINTDDMLTTTHKKFQQLIHNTFIRAKSSEKWKSKIETFLKNVDAKLKEISAERLILIRKQHRLAAAMEKMEKIENITPSFTMSAYERTIANVMKLGALLHDYEVSVGKVRKEMYNHWHLISHMREHRNLLQIKLAQHTSKYDSMCEKHKNMRDYICKLKVKHVALQHELSEISFNVGLLDKPLLMQDYDDTQDAIDKLTVVVDDLRKQYDRVPKASVLRADMRKKSLKKTGSKSTRISENAASFKRPTRSNQSVSVKKSPPASENISVRNSLDPSKMIL